MKAEYLVPELVIPADWTFRNANVADTFERHVREQLPWYELATGAVAHVARHYIGAGGLVYDIGASTGNVSRSLAKTIEARGARIVSIESSAEMVERFEGFGEIELADALGYDFEPFDVAVMFLTLMFTPVAQRLGFLRRLYARTKPGGALIIFDKTEVGMGYLSTVLHRLTIAGKVATGCDPKEIIEKELSLAGVQRPLSFSFISMALPHSVEVFRFGEFAGYVIEAP